MKLADVQHSTEFLSRTKLLQILTSFIRSACERIASYDSEFDSCHSMIPTVIFIS